MRALLVYGEFKSNFYYIFPSEELHLFSSKISGCCIIDYLKSIFFKRRSDLSVFYTIKIYFCETHHFLKDFSVNLYKKENQSKVVFFTVRRITIGLFISFIVPCSNTRL